ncbi:winged helix-turn-helix transcriptional regulator [Halosimplex salinum]|uniref:winged helix-turn-helix transcriptional regulator n=1 Tax=Halosimplex salinum TaxID=1710538 RepID=UPI000F476409|nr:helix-turn-helix domain-containing protein [Halosimplex salinum]
MQTNDPDDPFADVDPQACPTAESLEVIGTQWRLNVLHDLQDGELRFNELKEATGASSRTLSQSLDALTDAGLVDKRMEEAAPVATYYSLTEKGEALGPVFDELDAWAREYVDPTDYTEE